MLMAVIGGAYCCSSGSRKAIAECKKMVAEKLLAWISYSLGSSELVARQVERGRRKPKLRYSNGLQGNHEKLIKQACKNNCLD